MLLSQGQPTAFPLITDYLQLTKPRIAALLVFTALGAMVTAVGGLPPLSVILGVVVGGWLAAAGASVLNQYLERDLDAQMHRTRTRPLPSGRIPPVNALLFGMGLLVWSFFFLGLLANLLAAVLALLGALYYVGIYTLLLKRRTSFNVVVGGAAGGFPILVGWAAAIGWLEPGALLLFGIVFFWTPPHSWALALMIERDYGRGDVPMMPVRYGARSTQIHIYWYVLHLIALTLFIYAIGLFGNLYLITMIALAVGLLWYASRLLVDASKTAAKRLYRFSSYYLLLLFLSMMLDAVIQ